MRENKAEVETQSELINEAQKLRWVGYKVSMLCFMRNRSDVYSDKTSPNGVGLMIPSILVSNFTTYSLAARALSPRLHARSMSKDVRSLDQISATSLVPSLQRHGVTTTVEKSLLKSICSNGT